MPQQTIKYKKIVKKLLHSNTTPLEREMLNDDAFIHNTIHQQWEAASDMYTDEVKEKRMLTNILHTIDKRRNGGYFRQKSYQYGLVASIALLIVFGTLSTFLLLKTSTPEVWYVMNSGRQSMDSVKLADGTCVILNAGSKLTYPKEFSNKKREVFLSGQAFFRVHPNKELPFIVKTKSLDITALGTDFEVFSFDADNKVETILLNGKIKVEPKNNKGVATNEYILSPNEKLSCNRDAVSIDVVDANSYSAWRTGGRLSFKNETLAMILPRLEKWYGQKIECPEKIANNCRFSFTLHYESLDLILSMISHTAPITYKLESNDYYVLKELM